MREGILNMRVSSSFPPTHSNTSSSLLSRFRKMSEGIWLLAIDFIELFFRETILTWDRVLLLNSSRRLLSRDREPKLGMSRSLHSARRLLLKESVFTSCSKYELENDAILLWLKSAICKEPNAPPNSCLTVERLARMYSSVIFGRLLFLNIKLSATMLSTQAQEGRSLP